MLKRSQKHDLTNSIPNKPGTFLGYLVHGLDYRGPVRCGFPYTQKQGIFQMTRTDHATLLESVQTKELVLTNEEFYELKKRIEAFHNKKQ